MAKNTIQDYNELRERATSALEDDFQRGGDPKIVAETVLRIVQNKTPRLEYAVGKEKRYRTLKRILPQSMLERGIRRHWKLDE